VKRAALASLGKAAAHFRKRCPSGIATAMEGKCQLEQFPR